MDFFGEKGTLVVATKHEKETIVGPLFQKAFPWFLLPCGPLDTDAFGTFSGEKERIGTPLEVLKQKCQAASQLVQADFYFATEASFGPHPECPFLPFYEEWVMLYAPSLALEWVEVKRSTQTNFRTMEITTWPWRLMGRTHVCPFHGPRTMTSRHSSTVMRYTNGIMEISRIYSTRVLMICILFRFSPRLMFEGYMLQ